MLAQDLHNNSLHTKVEARDLTRRSVADKRGEDSVFTGFPNTKMVTQTSQNGPKWSIHMTLFRLSRGLLLLLVVVVMVCVYNNNNNYYDYIIIIL